MSSLSSFFVEVDDSSSEEAPFFFFKKLKALELVLFTFDFEVFNFPAEEFSNKASNSEIRLSRARASVSNRSAKKERNEFLNK